MKLLLSTTAALWLVTVTTAYSSNHQQDLLLQEEFHAWKEQQGKAYETSDELLHRMDIWMENHVLIESHNTQIPTPSYFLGHNQFSDLTLDEFQKYNKLGLFSPGVLMRKSSSGNVRSSAIVDVAMSSHRKLQDLPDTVDWVQGGAVAPVKNQGMCGSCWAFSAICAIEGAHYIDNGELVALSEQELVDCDKLDMGCGGGLMDNAFLFDENSTGICSEEDYPYVGHRQWLKGCTAQKGLCDSVTHTRVQTFVDVNNTEHALMEALAWQPVSVAIEADQQSFQFYKSGVYNDPECGNRLDHGVAAVGYGTTDNGQDYWVVRNSWGSSWGAEGYIKMSRQSNNVNGTCGILSFASRPILRDD